LGITLDKCSGRRYTYDGIEFSAGDDGDIENIRFWSTDYRMDKKTGVCNTLLVDEYGRNNLMMPYARITCISRRGQVIAFGMVAYDSTDLYDTAILKDVEISDHDDRFQEEWHSCVHCSIN
jgi:hypothetical protein